MKYYRYKPTNKFFIWLKYYRFDVKHQIINQFSRKETVLNLWLQHGKQSEWKLPNNGYNLLWGGSQNQVGEEIALGAQRDNKLHMEKSQDRYPCEEKTEGTSSKRWKVLCFF